MHGLRFRYLKNTKMMSRATLVMFIILMGITLNLYNNTAGAYNPVANFIVVFPKDNSVNTQMYSSLHEIGHFVWFKKLDDSQRQEYATIFNDSDEYITWYSSTRLEENFAEEYANSVYCGVDLNRISDSRVEYFEDNYDYLYGFLRKGVLE